MPGRALNIAPAVQSGGYGKLPTAGDFVSFGLEPAFVRAWDDWLSDALGHAKAVGANSWPTRWRAAPTWCLAAKADVLDPRAVAAVWTASFDRARRAFPFTIVALSSSLSPAALLRRAVPNWWDAAATLAERARAGAYLPDRVKAAMATLPTLPDAAETVPAQPEPAIVLRLRCAADHGAHAWVCADLTAPTIGPALVDGRAPEGCQPWHP